LADFLVGRVGQALQHVFEITIRFDAVSLAVFDKSVKDGATLARFFRAEEQPVLFVMNWTVERSCSLFQFKDFSVAAAGGADFGCEEFLEGNAFG
jgi:hypothetical protein